jgi:hypothetical protein
VDFLLRELLLALPRAERRPPLLADFLALFLAAPREVFFPALRLDFLPAFFADLRRRALGVRARGSSNSSAEVGVEAGVGAGVLSIGSGSIQPEPDQPISI